MNATTANNWYELNQRYLAAALAGVRSALERCVKPGETGRTQGSPLQFQDAQSEAMEAASSPQVLTSTEKSDLPHIPDDSDTISGSMSALSPHQADTRDTSTFLSALEALCVAFRLSAFERDVLLMCAGVELDSTFVSLCAAAQGDAQRTYPTFSLALAALPNSHWSALMLNAPLRHWRLLEVGTGNTLTTSQLRIDERILHYLVGLSHLDARLATVVEPVRAAGDLVPSHAALKEEILAQWTQAEETATFPAVQLCGNEVPSKRAIAAAVCEALGLNLSVISAYALPLDPAEFEIFTRLWEREVILSGSALLLDCDDLDPVDGARERSIMHLIESARGAIIVSSRERWRTRERPLLTFEVRKPTAGEQRTIWQRALGSAAPNLNGKVEALVSQFNLDTASIVAASSRALGRCASIHAQPAFVGASLPTASLASERELPSPEEDDVAEVIWDSCRLHARPQLDDLAERSESTACWEDLVLPELQRRLLRDIAAHVRQRSKVYETWGFAARGARGLGISALFAGASGTGKTMAAEVLANELRLDVYRIDLSQVVSKYIGETEKNLKRVFDAAEEGGAILLFDEADALFGKRSEVKDSHDRYANIEVSYLLQRMEAYRGMAILTTNMKSALDNAFLRRIRFIVQFPFPDATQRMEIWRRIFPTSTPTEGLEMTKLAKLNVTGGNIRNIALNAAFLAADAQEPVRMTHLLQAARSEYGKLEKSLTDAEIGGWI